MIRSFTYYASWCLHCSSQYITFVTFTACGWKEKCRDTIATFHYQCLNKSLNRNHLFAVTSKISRPSTFSLVWTQSNMQPKKINDHSSNRLKVMPYLIPWKRAGYWRCFMQNSVSISNNGSLSAIRYISVICFH